MKILITALVVAMLITGCSLCLPADDINIQAIIAIESGGNELAYNKSSEARGLMQITPICWREYLRYHSNELTPPIDHLYNAEYNVRVGTWYLMSRLPSILRAWKIDDSVDNILICYNWGPGNFKKWFKNGAKIKSLPLETQNYLKKYHKLTKKGDL